MAWGDWKEKTVSILGEQYTVRLSSDDKKYNNLKGANGYMDNTVKEIVVRDYFGAEDVIQDQSILIKKNIRHEIIHAFLYESGLDCDSSRSGSWAIHEEMVDWFAIQMPKLIKVFKELDII